MKTFFLFLVSTVLSISAAAQVLESGYSLDNDEPSYPEGDLRPERMGFLATGVNKEQFDHVMARGAEIYQPIFREKGLQLDVVPLWDNPQPNALAMPHPQNPNRRGVLMFGGLARHPEMTPDGLLMIVCHEIGHHIGGAPTTNKRRWAASNEGQADYYATVKCARKVFAPDNNVELMTGQRVPTLALEKCSSSFNSDEEVAICLRTVQAGEALARTLRALTQEAVNRRMPERNIEIPLPLLSTPDEREVVETSHTHPQAQCRLDTMFQGAICHVSADEDVAYDSAETGTCARRLGDRDGVRPRCWFSPDTPVTAPHNAPPTITLGGLLFAE